MNTLIKAFRSWNYNKRKKAWRKLNHPFPARKIRYKLVGFLYLCLFFEAALLFPRQRDTIYMELRKLFTASREFMEETIDGVSSAEGTNGEVRERGFSFDLKEGELKIWQKVERQFFREPD